jgi:hypothetical protein
MPETMQFGLPMGESKGGLTNAIKNAIEAKKKAVLSGRARLDAQIKEQNAKREAGGAEQIDASTGASSHPEDAYSDWLQKRDIKNNAQFAKQQEQQHLNLQAEKIARDRGFTEGHLQELGFKPHEWGKLVDFSDRENANIARAAWRKQLKARVAAPTSPKAAMTTPASNARPVKPIQTVKPVNLPEGRLKQNTAPGGGLNPKQFKGKIL